jgi:hypothetical protein
MSHKYFSIVNSTRAILIELLKLAMISTVSGLQAMQKEHKMLAIQKAGITFKLEVS